MKLKKFIKAVNGHVVDGSEYGWQCFGPNARWLTAYDLNELHVAAVYDSETNKIYTIEVMSGNDEVGYKSYMWIDPDYRLNYFNEANVRNVNPLQCFDDVNYNEVADKTAIITLVKRAVDCYNGDGDSVDDNDNDNDDKDNISSTDEHYYPAAGCWPFSSCTKGTKDAPIRKGLRVSVPVTFVFDIDSNDEEEAINMADEALNVILDDAKSGDYTTLVSSYVDLAAAYTNK